MQRLVLLCVVTVAACGEDDRNKTTPDTALVEVPAAVSKETRVRILFEALGNANTFFCKLDDGAPSPCISPFEADVTDGEHTFEVAAALNANVDETPATHAWRVDSAVPETAITSAPPALDNATSPQFSFTGNDGTRARAAGDVTFECALDGGAFATCTSPHTITNVIDGVHSFAVRAKDEAGNVDPSPAMHGWTLDSTAPETAIDTGPGAGATSGPSGSFTFSSPDATAFECSIDGATFTACTSPRAFTLGNGPHTFAVRAKDAVGIVDPSPAMRAWTVDAIAPPVTIDSTPNNPSNVTTPMFAFSSTDATATFECQIDGVVTFTACTSPFTSPTLTGGNRTFRVRATDPVGNVGAPDTFAWVVDLVAPTVTINSQPSALSNDTTPTVTFTTAGSPVTTQCRVDNGGLTNCSASFSPTVGEGMHTLTIVVTDAAGNVGSATTNMFEVDLTPPSVMIDTQPAALSNDTTPTVTFTTAGNPTSTQCQVNSGALTSCSGSFTPTVGAGTHTITIRVTDGATNTASATTNMFTIDVTPPTVTLTNLPASLSNDTTPSIGFSVNETATTQCQVDSGTLVNCTSIHTFGTTGDGPHTITVRATDSAGNIGSATTASFTIDTVGPTLAFTEQAPANWPVSYFDFRFTVGDSTTVACSVDTAAFTACTSPHTTSVAYGVAHTFRVRGTDAAGNQTTITSSAWTPQRGLVIHYPWEQGDTDNTSLLRQRATHSPDGVTPTITQFVGGWAGSALGSTVTSHQYAATNRALTSAPDGNYAASFWIRAVSGGAADPIFSTMNGTTAGLQVSLAFSPAAGTQLVFTAREGGATQTVSTAITLNRWVHVGMRTTGPGKGLEIFIDGMPRTNLSSLSGFVANQAVNLTVGSWNGVDVDDLRFYNTSFANTEMCTELARGFFVAGGPCVSLSPGFEIDFENNRVSDTGAWNLTHSLPPTGEFDFLAHTLGNMLRLLGPANWGYTTGNDPTPFASRVAAAPGHSFTFEFVPQAVFGRIIDFTRPCSVTGGLPLCGISVTYPDDDQIHIYTGTPAQQKTTILGTAQGLVPDRFNNVVVTEQRGANGTISLTVFVNETKTTIPITGDVYGIVNNTVLLANATGLLVDEYEFWPVDLQTDLEMLCENGIDGEFDVVTNTCLTTYGP